MIRPPTLSEILGTFPSVLVGYSGGVDSALLAVMARRVLGKERAAAAIGRSASYPAEQHAQALEIARQFDLRLLEISTGELSDPRYTRNSPDRCYFCKQELWRQLRRLAETHGFAVVADGTHAGDSGDHRPGTRAGREAGVRSPLLEAGYTKDDVRREARALGIPIWDAPAAPCLSSRVLYGLAVTPDRLRQVEAGEAFLREAGVRGDLRVRHRGDEARIEVRKDEIPLVQERRDQIVRRLLDLGFARVTLDLAGYRRGSLLGDATTQVEMLGERS
jgi:uncharacterized protein